MGYDVHGYVVMGVKIKYSQLFEKVSVPGCKHKIGKAHKFCPECGKPVKTTEERPIPGGDEDGEQYNGLDVVTVGNYDLPDREVIVGKKLAETRVLSYSGEEKLASPIDHQRIMIFEREVREALGDAPFSTNVQLWLCVYESY